MGVKVKGGMHCPRCGPVAAQKQTHKARSLLLGPLTYGAVQRGCLGFSTGQTVALEIDGIGTVTNRISADAKPTTAIPAAA